MAEIGDDNTIQVIQKELNKEGTRPIADITTKDVQNTLSGLSDMLYRDVKQSVRDLANTLNGLKKDGVINYTVDKKSQTISITPKNKFTANLEKTAIKLGNTYNLLKAERVIDKAINKKNNPQLNAPEILRLNSDIAEFGKKHTALKSKLGLKDITKNTNATQLKDSAGFKKFQQKLDLTKSIDNRDIQKNIQALKNLKEGKEQKTGIIERIANAVNKVISSITPKPKAENKSISQTSNERTYFSKTAKQSRAISAKDVNESINKLGTTLKNTIKTIGQTILNPKIKASGKTDPQQQNQNKNSGHNR